MANDDEQPASFVERFKGAPPTEGPTPQPVPPTKLDDAVVQARTAGHSWDEINQYLGQKRQEAVDAGHSTEDVDRFLGFKSGSALEKVMDARAKQFQAANKEKPAEGATPPTPIEQTQKPEAHDVFAAFKGGLEESSGGMIARGTAIPDVIMPAQASRAQRIAHMAGVAVGDIPAMVAGALGGAIAGTGAAPGVGTAAGGFAGFFLPSYIKHEYIDAAVNGHVKSAGDYAERQASVLWNSTKDGLTGAATAMSGGAADTLTVGMGQLARFSIKSGAELATMTGVADAMEGKLPSLEELQDGAIILAGFHGAGMGAKYSKTIMGNIGHRWAETDQTPADIVREAQRDPSLRAILQTPSPVEDAKSSKSPVKAGDIIQSVEQAPGDTDEQIKAKYGDFVVGKNTEVDKRPALEKQAAEEIAKAKEVSAAAAQKPGGQVSQTNPTIGMPPNSPTVARPAITDAQAIENIKSHIADIEAAPTWFEWAKEVAKQGYIQFVNPEHPINQLTDAVRGMGPLPDVKNPDFMLRVAEVTGNSRFRYMFERGMVNVMGEKTGPGYHEIFDKLTKEEKTNYPAYAFAKFAIEKAEQGKATGFDLRDAQQVVDKFERGGKAAAPPIPLAQIAQMLGTSVNNRLPGTDKATDTFGPHYMPRPFNYISMHDMPDAEYEKKYGKGTTHDMVLAHELGHAAADNVGLIKGFDVKKFRELEDELMVVSRRFKPGMWDNPAMRSQWDPRFKDPHFRKNDELIADAFATWMTDPSARNHMPVFESMVKPGNLAKFGVKDPMLGTNVSRAFEAYQDWRNGTFKYLRDAGVMNNENFLKAVAQNKMYAPGYRVEDVQDQDLKGAGPGKAAYNPVKEFKGSELKVQNLLKSDMEDAALRVELGNRNMAMQAIAEAILKTNQGRWAPKDLKVTHLTPDELRAINPHDVFNSDDTRAIFRRVAHPTRDNEVPIFYDGQQRNLIVDDPDMVKYLKGFDHASLSVWGNMVASVSKITRGAIVLNPIFPVKLMMYDVPWQAITKPDFRNTLGATYHGIKDIFLDKTGQHDTVGAQMYDKWLRSAGAERVFDGLTKNDYIKEMLRGEDDPSYQHGAWNPIASGYHGLRAWAQMLSQVQRVGNFHQRMMAGEGSIKAGVGSSDAAFHRAGFGGPQGKLMNATQPFYMAHVNSLNQTIKSQFGIGHTTTGTPFRGLEFTAKALALVTLPMLASYFANRDTEWYKAAPDWQKNNGILIPIGDPDKGGHTFYLPLPPLIGLLYGGIPRMLVERFQQDNKYAFDHMGSSLIGALAPPGIGLASNVATPVVEWAANHSFFTGQPLVSEDAKKNILAPEQYGPYTSETAKIVSHALHDNFLFSASVPPPVIDNFIQGWGGSLGKMTVQAVERSLQKAGIGPAAQKPSLSIEDIPGLSSFFSRYPSSSAQPIRDFRDHYAQLTATHGSILKTLETGDMSRFKELTANPNVTAMPSKPGGLAKQEIGQQPGSPEMIQELQRLTKSGNIPLVQEIMKVNHALDNLTQVIKKTYADPRVSPDEKRQIIDMAAAGMQQAAERGLKDMQKAGFK